MLSPTVSKRLQGPVSSAIDPFPIKSMSLKPKKKRQRQQSDSKNTSTSTTSSKSSGDGDGDDESAVALTFTSPDRGPGSTLSDEVYNKVCQGLIAGHSLTTVGLEAGVGRNLVNTIKERIRGSIPNWKKRTSRMMGELITELCDSLADDLRQGKLSPDRKSVHLGILSDKKSALDGDRTLTIEHKRVTSGEDFEKRIRDYLSGLPSANAQATEGRPEKSDFTEVIDVSSDACTKSAPDLDQTGAGGDPGSSRSSISETDLPS